MTRYFAEEGQLFKERLRTAEAREASTRFNEGRLTFVNAEVVLTGPRLGQERSKMAGLRIFSYLPNPRVWKATIAARFCGVDVEIRGASGKELRDWLWGASAGGAGTSIAVIPCSDWAGGADRREALQDRCFPGSTAVRQCARGVRA
jgi:hypothetical protein